MGVVRVEIEPPNQKQQKFFLAKTRFVAYGGARGGGKSWAVRRKALLLGVNYPGIRMLLLRRTLPELRENHVLPLLRDLAELATYRESDKAFNFINGSRLKLGYCDSERDVLQYQGQEYDVIFMDEATHFTEFQFSTLTAALRGANDRPKRMYLTCNPGGVGHAWVKRLFVDRRYRGSERPEDYTFIPARVYDNQVLLEKDPDYLQMLKNQPEDIRRAWLEGDWNVFAGQYFKMWREELHVVRGVKIEDHWRRYISLDYGLDMLACYWIAVDAEGLAYVYREIYKPGLLISEAAQRIVEANVEQVNVIFAPSDLWNRRQDTGKSVAEVFAEHGLYLQKADNRRVQGWMELAEWLKVRDRRDEQTGALYEYAALRFLPCCPEIIRTLPQLQYDPHHPNDVANEPHELTHGPDAIRYFVAGRPQPTAVPTDTGGVVFEGNDLQSFLQFGQ